MTAPDVRAMFRAEIVTTKGTKDTKGGGEFDGLSRRVVGCALEVHPGPGMEFLFVSFVPFVAASV